MFLFATLFRNKLSLKSEAFTNTFFARDSKLNIYCHYNHCTKTLVEMPAGN